MKIEIREILKKDNLKIKEVLVSVMNEFGVPDEGTAMQDEELNFMFESYQDKNSKYYIVLADNFISGGAGIVVVVHGILIAAIAAAFQEVSCSRRNLVRSIGSRGLSQRVGDFVADVFRSSLCSLRAGTGADIGQVA